MVDIIEVIVGRIFFFFSPRFREIFGGGSKWMGREIGSFFFLFLFFLGLVSGATGLIGSDKITEQDVTP